MISRPARRARAASTVAVAASSCCRLGSSAARFVKRPSIVLDVGNLEPVGAERHREVDDLFEMFEILPMNDCVDGQRQPCLAHQPRNPMLCLLGTGEAGDPIPGARVGILQA